MASRGRDLTFSILSDVGKFDLRRPAEDLEDLGRAADTAGRDLDTLARDTRSTDLEGTLGRDARRAAGDVDDAFDTIRRASRQSARDVDDDTDTMRRNVRDVGTEASSTAREMGASFSGSTDDIVDAFQELGANAGEAFGPIGVAAGVAASIGIGLIRAEQEKLKEMTSDLVEEMLDAGGRLTEAAITNRVNTMAAEDPSGFIKYNEAAIRLGISIRDVARARAGDAEAAQRVIARLDELDAQQRKEAESAGGAIAQRTRSTEALGGLRRELGLTAEASAAAEAAVATATSAGSSKIVRAADTGGAAWDDLRANLGRPVTARVVAKAPTKAEIDAVVGRIRRSVGTIVVPLRVGQSQFANTSSSTRYRE